MEDGETSAEEEDYIFKELDEENKIHRGDKRNKNKNQCWK